MFLSGIDIAVPERRYTQKQCWEALQRADRPELNARVRSILQGILTHDNGIETRALALDSLDEGFDLDPDTLHRRFVTHAPRLASQAAAGALRDAALTPERIDAVVVSTCTGYLCPGLSSYVTESLGLRPDVIGLDLVGQGCGAALPNLRTADALVASSRAEHVLSICVEVCSAAFYLDNDLGVLVSACLFGDGAGAAVLSRDARADSLLIALYILALERVVTAGLPDDELRAMGQHITWEACQHLLSSFAASALVHHSHGKVGPAALQFFSEQGGISMRLVGGSGTLGRG